MKFWRPPGRLWPRGSQGDIAIPVSKPLRIVHRANENAGTFQFCLDRFSAVRHELRSHMLQTRNAHRRGKKRVARYRPCWAANILLPSLLWVAGYNRIHPASCEPSGQLPRARNHLEGSPLISGEDV